MLCCCDGPALLQESGPGPGNTRLARKEKECKPQAFPEKGGPGYDPSRPPNPECPECWGDGKGRVVIHDTRNLEDGEAAFYAGVKVTKDGVHVLTEDRATYLQMVGRHLGMWNDKIGVEVTENPLMALIQQIQQSHSTLPIVHDDPERRKAPDVQDVQEKKGGCNGCTPHESSNQMETSAMTRMRITYEIDLDASDERLLMVPRSTVLLQAMAEMLAHDHGNSSSSAGSSIQIGADWIRLARIDRTPALPEAEAFIAEALERGMLERGMCIATSADGGPA